MPLGHVAVVTGTVNDRVITIDQSHWGQSGISRNIRVVDVSPGNDWSAVRVELNRQSGTFGSIYPTYGFIYSRPDSRSNVMVAEASENSSEISDQYAEAPVTAGGVEDHYLSREFVPHRRHLISRVKRHVN
ncbi:hypothetical protein AOE01nite_24620 [Acetobacter oeni]|uniref:Peptidase C51 domain-containing protein n=2 Tax=Acetobacter oeni TaxID=304077 RepID=A0A511XMR8_9PROT|nr:hypothetical protein AA21952_1378 [Acetobacter oeni LMG 21952]GEN64238.1 hypothetical protein AOE01nite_24620 [Acetobacter oeni]